jgi:hypothetical protein
MNMKERMQRSAASTVVSLGVALAGVTFASSALAVPWNLQVRHTSVPNSCDWPVFEPELKIINTSTFADVLLSEIFVEFNFEAGPDEIEAVHPEGTFASIFDASGAFVSYDSATIVKAVDFPDSQFAPDRRANQTWRVVFGPPAPPPAPQILVPHNGGFATLTVTLRRAGGASPFDVGCKNFTRVERDSPDTFVDDKFYNLIFTSTQQHICERFLDGTIDPNTGIFLDGSNGCPQ